MTISGKVKLCLRLSNSLVPHTTKLLTRLLGLYIFQKVLAQECLKIASEKLGKFQVNSMIITYEMEISHTLGNSWCSAKC